MTKIEFLDNNEPPLSASNLNAIQDNCEAVSVPTGAISQFAGATAPANWLLCDGSAVSRTTYSALFSVIGDTYGTGDGSTTFNLPNLKGRIPVGYDSTQTEFNSLGKTGGEKKHTQTLDELCPHSHNVSAYSLGASSTVKVASGTYANVGNPTGNIVIAQTGGGQPFNVLQPYIAMNYIIKT